MPDYWCGVCGGRTAMMGHGGRHDPKTLGIVQSLVDEGVQRARAVEVVGLWQIGEVSLPADVPNGGKGLHTRMIAATIAVRHLTGTGRVQELAAATLEMEDAKREFDAAIRALDTQPTT